MKLASDVAGNGVGMPRPHHRWVQLSELADRSPCLFDIEVERRMGNPRTALSTGLDVQRVHEVRDERHPVCLAKQRDQPGGVTRHIDHAKAGHLIVLGDGAGHHPSWEASFERTAECAA